MQREQFMAVWNILDSAFPGEREPAMLETYAGQLASASPDLFAAGADWCISNDEWFPTVARLREATRLVGKSAQFREGRALPAAPIGNQNGRVRSNRFGSLMAKAGLAGFGCEWVTRGGTELVCRPRGDETIVIAFDAAVDEIRMNGVSVPVDEIKMMIGDEELNLNRSDTGGHDHKRGACRVCTASAVRWAR